jgi:NodT family efflux transporter outer membrane factor (OMF) lipoprotein
MRSLLPLALAAFIAACGAPAYQPPTVRVAPSYGALAHGSAAPSRDSVVTASSGGVTGVSQRAGASGAPTSRSSGGSAQYSAAISAEPFWRELGDTTLAHLIEEALRTSVDVDAAEARVTSARATRRVSSYDLGPTVTAIGSATRQRSSIAQVPGLTTQLPQQNLYDVGFDASWEVDVFRRVNRTVNAYGAQAASAEHGLKDVQVTLAAEVARTYFELRGAEQQLAVARRNAENQRRTVSLTEDRLAAGRGTAFDTERAKSVLQLTLAAIPTIEAQIAADRNRIATLVGRAPNTVPADWLGAGQLPTLPDTVRIGSPQELVRRRPDVLSAERQVAAQGLFVSAAQAEYLPRITLAASAGYAATSFDSLSRRGTSRVVAGPVITFPLLDMGRVKARVDVAHAHEDEAKAQYNATVLRAVEETETALVTYDRAHARLALLGEAVRASTRAWELAQQRFDAGLTDFLQVLDAQRTLLDAENQLAVAHASAATSLVAVYKAIGGTWPIN